MARRRGLLILLALLVCVLGLHAIALEWMARQWLPARSLQLMPEPMYTRTLRLETPPAPLAIAPAPIPRRKHAASPASLAPAAPASTPTLAEAQPAPPETPPAPVEQTALTAEPEVAAPPAPAATASQAEPPVDPLADWPSALRLRYRLTGYYRGELTANAQVTWQRQSDRYQVRIVVDLGLGVVTVTSQGKVTPQRLEPEMYEEAFFGRRRPVEFLEDRIRLTNRRTLPRPVGTQDSASQFVELHRKLLAAGPGLVLGTEVPLTMARPNGIDAWVYEVVAREILTLTLDGKPEQVETIKLYPKPLPNRTEYTFQQFWYAPSLNYLPARVRVEMGDREGFVELDLVGVDRS